LPNIRSKNGGQEAEHDAKEAAQEASPWLSRIARFGYATKGVVYIVVGVLALGVAAGMGGRTTDPPGALQAIGAQPFGRVMLGFVALGLAGYALWRLVEAVADPHGEGYGVKSIPERIGNGAAGLGYSVLAFTAGELIITSGGGSSPKDWTASLLSLTFGWVVVLGVGIGVAGYSLYELYNSYKASFEEHFKSDQMSDRLESVITNGGRFGLAARAVVIGIAGSFLIVSALWFDPSEAAGLGDALQALLRQPFGSWLLGVVALGLMTYGLLMLAVARYGQLISGSAF
jgi:hypothetical protein